MIFEVDQNYCFAMYHLHNPDMCLYIIYCKHPLSTQEHVCHAHHPVLNLICTKLHNSKLTLYSTKHNHSLYMAIVFLEGKQ